MSISIVPVDKADVPAIVEIEKAAFSDPWSARSFHDALAHPSVFFACARGGADGNGSSGGHVLGYVVAWFVADEGEIANLAVAPEGWRQGIGRTLLDAALSEARARKANAVYLEVRDSNERARRLYGSRGFEEIGRRRGYYQLPDEDAIVLRRTLTTDV
ncbi:MAG: ribosomal protein S18-alanine N-acetyltransferase [bacterium]